MPPQTDNVRKKTAVPVDASVVILRGDFDVKKLHGIYWPMMALMVKTAGRRFTEERDHAIEKDDMLQGVGERVNGTCKTPP